MNIKYFLSVFIVGILIGLPAFSFAEDCRGKASDNGRTYTCEGQSNPPNIPSGYKHTRYSSLTCPGGLTCHRFECTNGSKNPNCTITCAEDEELDSVSNTCKKKSTPPPQSTGDPEREKCKEGEKRNSKTGKCENCNDPGVCCGIQLNTNVPFIGSCIAYGDTDTAGSETTKSNQITAFPKLMGALMNIVMTAVLIIGFLMIVVAGVMMTMGGYEAKNFQKGKEMIFKVGAVLALLGLSGVILKLINPTFFT